MNSLKNIFLLLAVLSIFSSCEKVFMAPNPDTDNLSIFEEYATLVKEKYAMLEFKGVDIDQLTDSIRTTITPELSNQALFEKLAIITLRLRDGHSSLGEVGKNELTENSMSADYDFLTDYPPGIDLGILLTNYIGLQINPAITYLWLPDSSDIKAIWGTLPQDQEIGYIWIPSWNNDISEEEIEAIFEGLQNTKGIVFDMRLNTGGDPSLATKFASYFTDSPVYTGFERFKTGPDAADFSDSPVTLQPAESDFRYTKPVIVLIDRYVYSAATTFSYSVSPLSNITFVGQRAGGGSGSVADGFLANGWYWALSTSEFIDHQDRHLDDGFDPDIAVALDTLDKMHDEVLDRAMMELQ